MTDYKEVNTVEHETGQEQRAATFKATQIIWLLLGILEAAIALRVIFKLIAVNASNSFATLLFNVTDIFVAPFQSLTGAPTSGGMVLEISSLIAMFVYFLIAWAIVKVVTVVFYAPRGTVSVKQTSVADHSTLIPTGVQQTTVTEETKTQTPRNL